AEFSVRGGIIDLYPVTEKHPVRMELFDDEIDSLRYFDEADQRSLKRIEQITIGPASEWMLTHQDYSRAINRLEEATDQVQKTMKESETKHKMLDQVEADLHYLQENQLFQGMYKYSGLFYEENVSLLDYLPKDGLLLFDEYNRIQDSAQQ